MNYPLHTEISENINSENYSNQILYNSNIVKRIPMSNLNLNKHKTHFKYEIISEAQVEVLLS